MPLNEPPPSWLRSIFSYHILRHNGAESQQSIDLKYWVLDIEVLEG